MPAQDEELERVERRIAQTVLRFCEKGPARFHLHELEGFVVERVPSVTPGSPGRILRQLRRRGVINYQVLSRRDSLYELLPAEAA